AVTGQLDWHNPKGHEYLFDLSKPLPLIEDQGRQVVLANYFVNNDREYLKGTSYWVQNENEFYAYACHWMSTHDVNSKKRIIVVTNVKVMKWYDYRCGITDVYQTYCHSSSYRRSSAGSQKLSEEA
nr:hypothetical protein [Tanacetum cinerariifolium]